MRSLLFHSKGTLIPFEAELRHEIENAIPQLVGLLKDEDWSTRYTTAAVLGHLADQREFIKVLCSYSADFHKSKNAP